MRTTLTTLFRLTAIGILATVIAVGSAGCSQEKSKTTPTKKTQAKRKAHRTKKLAKSNSAAQKSVTANKRESAKSSVATKGTKKTKASGPTSKFASAKTTGNSQSDTRATKPVVQTPVKQVATNSSTPTSPQDVAEDMQPIGDDPTQLREHYSNVIYATIRIRMEEAIQRRAKLFKQGTSPKSEEIVNLERQILKARSLLVENGETVQPVHPPISQRTTPR